MSVNETGQFLTFHCTSCKGRIQTPAHFAGVSAPCPFCAQIVTAPHARPAQSFPAPATKRAAIRRLLLPEHLSDPPLEPVRFAPREIKPQSSRTEAALPTKEPISTLDQLLNTMVAMEEPVESRPRLRRKGKVPFERPLRRTDDHTLRSLRSSRREGLEHMG